MTTDVDRRERILPAADVLVHGRARDAKETGDLLGREERLLERERRQAIGHGATV